MKYTLIILLLISVACKSQLYMSPELGYSTTHNGAGSVKIGYRTPINIVVEADERFPIFDYKHAAYFGASAGYEIDVNDNMRITPLFNTSFRMISSDKKTQNGWVYGAALREEISDNNIFLQQTYIDKTFFIGIGLRMFMNDKERIKRNESTY